MLSLAWVTHTSLLACLDGKGKGLSFRYGAPAVLILQLLPWLISHTEKYTFLVPTIQHFILLLYFQVLAISSYWWFFVVIPKRAWTALIFQTHKTVIESKCNQTYTMFWGSPQCTAVSITGVAVKTPWSWKEIQLARIQQITSIY